MMCLRLRLLVPLLLVLCSAAYADPVSITGSTTSLTPSADGLTLHSNTTIYTLGTPFTLQTGVYAEGHSGQLTGTFPFSFMEDITIDGQTVSVTFEGSNHVSIAEDDAMLFSGPATYFSVANVTLTTFGFATPPLSTVITSDVTIQAEATGGQSGVTPEPGSIALVATGLLSLAGMVRRRFEDQVHLPTFVR